MGILFGQYGETDRERKKRIYKQQIIKQKDEFDNIMSEIKEDIEYEINYITNNIDFICLPNEKGILFDTECFERSIAELVKEYKYIKKNEEALYDIIFKRTSFSLKVN